MKDFSRQCVYSTGPLDAQPLGVPFSVYNVGAS